MIYRDFEIYTARRYIVLCVLRVVSTTTGTRIVARRRKPNERSYPLGCRRRKTCLRRFDV